MPSDERDLSQPAHPDARRDCPWGVLQAGLVYILSWLGSVSITFLTAAYLRPLSTFRVAVVLAIAEVPWALIPGVFLKLRGARALEILCFRRPRNWADLPVAAVAGILLPITIGTLRRALGFAPAGTGYSPDMRQALAPLFSLSPSLVDFVRVTTVGPISEETYYRAFLYPALRKHVRPAVGILLQGLIFGLGHMGLGPDFSPTRIVVASAAGIMYGLCFQWSGSIFPGMLMHACFNGTTFLLNLLNLLIRPG